MYSVVIFFYICKDTIVILGCKKLYFSSVFTPCGGDICIKKYDCLETCIFSDYYIRIKLRSVKSNTRKKRVEKPVRYGVIFLVVLGWLGLWLEEW